MAEKFKVTVTYTDDKKNEFDQTLLAAIICMIISFMIFMVFYIIRQHDLHTIVNFTPNYMYALMDSVARFKMGLMISQIFAVISGVCYLSYLLDKNSK